MTATELAKAMLEWGEMKEKLDALEEQIKGAVMELGKTQTVGNVRATYSKGRKKVDYESAASFLSATELSVYAKPVQYDYRKACLEHNAELEMFTEVGEPSVTVKWDGRLP